MSIWVNGKKNVLSMHTYSGVSVWRGWDLARGPAPGVSSYVYLQGLRSERGWERLILHQRLRARGVPGAGTALHVSPHLTPSQNRVRTGRYVTDCRIIIGRVPVAAFYVGA